MENKTAPEKYKVLIIDDDATIRTVIRTILTSDGFSIGAAKDADEAMALLDPPTTSYHLLLIDIHLPGINGIELLKNIREKKIQTPVLIISGAADTQNIEEAAQLKIAGFIVKPFNAVVLREKVQNALGMGISDLEGHFFSKKGD